MRENLSEEDLAIFDILTKPDSELTGEERDAAVHEPGFAETAVMMDIDKLAVGRDE